jgi:hypothetical protein
VLAAIACAAAACGGDDDGSPIETTPSTAVVDSEPATTSPDGSDPIASPTETSAPPGGDSTSGTASSSDPAASDDDACAGDMITAIKQDVRVGDGSELNDVIDSQDLGCSTELAISGEASVAYPSVGSCTITAPDDEAIGISRPSEQVLLEMSRGRLVCTFEGDGNLLYVCGTRAKKTAGTATQDCSADVHETSADTATVTLFAPDGRRDVDPGTTVRMIPGSIAEICADCGTEIYVPSELEVTSTPSGAAVRVGMAVENGEPVPGSGRAVDATPVTVELSESDVVPAPEPCCRVVVAVSLVDCGTKILNVTVSDELGAGLSYDAHADLDCPTLTQD